MTTRTATHVDTVSGLTVYAYPAYTSDTYSLANWETHRVRLTELASPNLCHYQGSLDDAKGMVWLAFLGASQPSTWGQRIAIIDLSGEVAAEETARAVAIAEADQIIEERDGVQVLVTYLRGTDTELLPPKGALQPGGTPLTNPNKQRLAGCREES